jgi:membrane protease subunit HflC
MASRVARVGGALLFTAAVFLLSGALYVVPETEQVIITRFGKPVRDPIADAGPKLKLPLIERVNRVEKRILAWDGATTEMPTRDKLYISVDTFARWRVTDPLEFFRRLRDERSAQSRLDDILGSETRNAIAKHDLIEVIRTTKERQPARDESLEEAAVAGTGFGVLHPIRKGRTLIETEVEQAARDKLSEFGIELLDVRFKRINYNQSVVEKIYERMISERQQIASRFRSEGEGEAAKILGDKERDLNVIESEAYRRVQELRGAADARATEIYAAAYGQSPAARDFYDFLQTMKTYERILGPETRLILSSDGELFRHLVGPPAE